MNPELPLRDIHLPAELGWWPPAYGWWLLGILLLALLVFLWRRWRRHRAQILLQVCKPALLELQRLEAEYNNDPNQLIRELSVLLRRSAMSLYGRHRISGLSGRRWLAFLDQQAGETIFSERFHKMLTELPYREHSDARAGDLVLAVRRWLQSQQGKRHDQRYDTRDDVHGEALDTQPGDQRQQQRSYGHV